MVKWVNSQELRKGREGNR